MNDVIYRQQAIDTIMDYPHGDVWNVENMDNMVCEIKTLPPAPSRTGEWIPVTERLPEEKQEVIVTVTRNNGSTFTERDGWTGTGFWGFGHRVIAWMPLPAPYTEETNAQNN